MCVNRSLKLAPASVVVPYQYSMIVWAVMFGYFVFGDVPRPPPSSAPPSSSPPASTSSCASRRSAARTERGQPAGVESGGCSTSSSCSATERDALFQGFARALFKNDMDALYKVVTSNFVWRYHDGVSTERVLTGRDAILRHLEERKAFFSASRFHDVVYHHLPDISFMTFRVSETVRATGEQREQQRHRALHL